MMEAKRPATILARIQDVYYEYPTPFRNLMTGSFIDRIGTNWIVPFLTLYVHHFDLPWVWYGCSLICAIRVIGFDGLHLQAKERLHEIQTAENAQHR